jgi:hypothetical protein
MRVMEELVKCDEMLVKVDLAIVDFNVFNQTEHRSISASFVLQGLQVKMDSAVLILMNATH